MVGCVGDDPAGRLLTTVLSAEGVDTAGLHVVRGVPSGTALITVARDGANGRLRPGDVEAASSLTPTVAAVLAQLEIPLNAVRAALTLAHASGAIAVLNPAPATGSLPDQLLALADVVVPNESEARALSGRPTPAGAAAWLLKHGCRSVIVTLGEQGALLARQHEPIVEVAAFKVEAVDTTAAGDAFCGTLVASLSAGEDLLAAAQRASAAGALATTVMGALPSLPTTAEVDRLLATYALKRSRTTLPRRSWRSRGKP